MFFPKSRGPAKRGRGNSLRRGSMLLYASKQCQNVENLGKRDPDKHQYQFHLNWMGKCDHDLYSIKSRRSSHGGGAKRTKQDVVKGIQSGVACTESCPVR